MKGSIQDDEKRFWCVCFAFFFFFFLTCSIFSGTELNFLLKLSKQTKNNPPQDRELGQKQEWKHSGGRERQCKQKTIKERIKPRRQQIDSEEYY